jgi:hypothetical protein
MPVYDDLPSVVLPAVADTVTQDRPSTPLDEEDLDELPTVRAVMDADPEAEAGADEETKAAEEALETSAELADEAAAGSSVETMEEAEDVTPDPSPTPEPAPEPELRLPGAPRRPRPIRASWKTLMTTMNSGRTATRTRAVPASPRLAPLPHPGTFPNDGWWSSTRTPNPRPPGPLHVDPPTTSQPHRKVRRRSARPSRRKRAT